MEQNPEGSPVGCNRPERQITPEICLVTRWGTYGTIDGQFSFPTGIDVDSNGNIFVADMGNNRIQEFELARPCPASTLSVGNGVCFITKWGSQGGPNSAGGQFQGPRGLEVNSQDHVFVTEQGNNRVQEFQMANPCPSGATQVTLGVCFIKMWGNYGTGKGEFKGAQSIAFDSKGNVFVADENNNRVQIFRFQNPCQPGTTQVAVDVCYFGQWGRPGNGPGMFTDSFFVTVDGMDDILVGDGSNSRVQKFHLEAPTCPSGMVKISKFVCYVTEFGGSPPLSYPILGSFGWPNGISIDSVGRVYVTDGGWAIQVFKP
jgi:sugar lactone lactonase YvrE